MTSSNSITKEQARTHIDLITLWTEGETIQKQTVDGTWIDEPSPTWELGAVYRAKVEPKYCEIGLQIARNRLGNIQVKIVNPLIVRQAQRAIVSYDPETLQILSVQIG